MLKKYTELVLISFQEKFLNYLILPYVGLVKFKTLIHSRRDLKRYLYLCTYLQVLIIANIQQSNPTILTMKSFQN